MLDQPKISITLSFDGAVMVGADAPSAGAAPDVARPLRIGWVLGANDIRSASARYRCHHMARALAGMGVDSAYFTDPAKAAEALADLDAVILVKRLDAGVLRVAAAARQAGTPLFLDLCDDLLADRYSKNTGGIHQIHFAAIAPALAGVVVPSAAMADRVQGYADGLGLRALNIHVIPDIAETRDQFLATERFLGRDPNTQDPPAPAKRKPGRSDLRKVLWFGNFGAPHSNFGICSLMPALPALAAVHRDLPLELTVISNHEELFHTVTAKCGFPTRYLPWSAECVYDALEEADVALLTGGDDAFCTIKSSNRILQALAADVPVVTGASSAISEFFGVVLTGNYEGYLRRILGADPQARQRQFVDPAKPILARYTPERLAGLWQMILRQAQPDAPQAPAPNRTVLCVVEAGQDPKALKQALGSARKAGLTCEVLVSPAALAERVGLRDILNKARVIPRILSDPKKLYPGILNTVAALVIDDPKTAVAQSLTGWAVSRGCPVLSYGDLSKSWPSDRVAPPAAPALAQPIQPGPYPERIAEDGGSDWVFVVHQNNRGWILDAICREIGSRQPETWQVVYNPAALPPAKRYFFSHFSLYQKFLRRFPDQMRAAKTLVWYTHPRDETPENIAALLADLKQTTQVIFTCAANRQVWLDRGLPPARGTVVLGAADPDLFTAHQRGSGAVGLSSSFYERKNPDCLLDLIRLLPHREFILLGRHWEQYALFEAMKAAPNFTYVSAPYKDYPKIYDQFDVFLSMSRLEGGPIPLIEAMMANAVPVASDTGFAPDVIGHRENGFLFAPDATAPEIAPLIEAAFEMQKDIRATVAHYSWSNFAKEIAGLVT